MTRILRLSPLIALLALLAAPCLRAQFSPALLQNESYWGDGRAEFDLYDAQVMRDGQLRHCEMTMVLARDLFQPPTTVSATPQARADPVPGIRMSETFTAPLGLSLEQRSLSFFWNAAADLIEGSAVTATDRGNSVAQVEAAPVRKTFCIEARNERGEVRDTDLACPKEVSAVLYDELPLRVRTIEFTRPAAEFEFQMAAPLANPGEFKISRASYKLTERAIEVEVREANAVDRFVLDRDFPFLLREWRMRDGSQFKLKNSLKAKVSDYTKNGDRERALKDPMLRHPD